MSVPAFLTDETAAVAVDWVELSAAVIGLGLGATAAVRLGALSLGDDIDGALGGASVAALGGGAVPGEPCDYVCLFIAAWQHLYLQPVTADDSYSIEVEIAAMARERLDRWQRHDSATLEWIIATHQSEIEGGRLPPEVIAFYQAEIAAIQAILAERG